MFKLGSCADEVYRSMEGNLIANQTETKHGFDKLAKATDYLSQAASIFDMAGMSEQADEIAVILEGLAKQFGAK